MQPGASLGGKKKQNKKKRKSKEAANTKKLIANHMLQTSGVNGYKRVCPDVEYLTACRFGDLMPGPLKQGDH